MSDTKQFFLDDMKGETDESKFRKDAIFLPARIYSDRIAYE